MSSILRRAKWPNVDQFEIVQKIIGEHFVLGDVVHRIVDDGGIGERLHRELHHDLMVFLSEQAFASEFFGIERLARHPNFLRRWIVEDRFDDFGNFIIGLVGSIVGLRSFGGNY
ncbi:MAG: hypothetical protein MZU97_05920 [Bacillus subtilis]|nr:hypothetical protein [Bacillus subtilis]